jgi:hypothetical protein
VNLKKLLFISVFYIAAIVCFSLIQHPLVYAYNNQMCAWEGSWNTNHGPLKISKLPNGNILGQFLDKTLQFEGVAQGLKVVGLWRVKENDYTQYLDAGDIVVSMANDCQSLTADSRFGFEKDNNPWSKNNISGTRTTIAKGFLNHHVEQQKSTGLESYTQKVLSQSPTQFELTNASILYTGAINTVSNQGQQFAAEHKQLANIAIEAIDLTGQKLRETREMNQGLSDLLTVQLALWKALQDELPPLKVVYDKEVLLFNINLEYQIKEDILWAVAESIEEQIKKLRSVESGPINESMAMSMLYSQLMVSYYDIIQLYNEKYTYVLTAAMLNHSVLYNPNLEMPEEIIKVIEPIHVTEFTLIEKLLLDSEENAKSLEVFSSIAANLNELQNRINVYSITELDSIIEKMESQRQNQLSIINDINNNDKRILLQVNIDQLTSYLDYYRELRANMKAKAYSASIISGVMTALKEKESIKLAYNGIIPADLIYGGFGSKLWGRIKNGANLVIGSTYAVADYVTAKVSNQCFEITEKTAVAWDKGLFSKEYDEFAKNYNEMDKKINKDTFLNTIAGPLHQTLQGNLEEGLGQAGMQKAKVGYKAFEEKLDSLSGCIAGNKTAANMITNIVLNVVTVGGYGLGKDMTNIADQKSTPEEIVTSSVGLILSVAPALSASNFVKTSSDNATKLAENLINSTSNAISEIGEATAKNAGLKTIYRKTSQEAVENTQVFINALKDSSVKVGSATFKQASNNLDKSIARKAMTQALYKQSQKELRETIVKNTALAPVKTLGTTLKAGGNVVKDMFAGAGSGYRNMVNKSLKDIIKKDGKLVYWGGSVLDNTYNSIFSNELNKYLANEYKDNTTSITTKVPLVPNTPPVTSGNNANSSSNNTSGKPSGWTYKQNPNVKVTETRYLNGKMTYTNDPEILKKQSTTGPEGFSKEALEHINKYFGFKNKTPVTNNNLKQNNTKIQSPPPSSQTKQACHPNDQFCSDNLFGSGATINKAQTNKTPVNTAGRASHNGTWSLTAQGLGPLVISGSSVKDSSNKIRFVNTGISGDTLSGYWCQSWANPCYTPNSRNTFRLVLSPDGKTISGQIQTLVRETISTSWHSFRGTKQ